ncbi:hypothetical protein PENTCL1PPCAC_18224, partial [Pristionchus entomophagus]
WITRPSSVNEVSHPNRRMIGLIVQLTAEFCKIWSTSSLRFITYTRDDLPNGSHEGDWIEIEFNSSGVMKGIKKVEDILETIRDQRGKMQVLDIFLVDFRREEAFCETFGVVKINKGKEGGKWIEERKIKDHCVHLWITISSNSQFSIEEQSLDRANSKDRKYSEKYKRLLDGLEKVKIQSPRKEIREGYREFDETILIVGFDHNSKRFFSSSRCGEAFINESIWIEFNQEKEVEKGDSFRARLRKYEVDDMHKVVKLYTRAELAEGVEVHATLKYLSVELNAVVVERRQSCFAIETQPFGLVTYSLDKSFLPSNLYCGDHLRVILHRYKDESKSDHPSKWQVTRLVDILEKKSEVKSDEVEWPENRDSKLHSNHGEEQMEEFSETIMIVGFDERFNHFFSSSCSGEAVVRQSVWKKQGEVKLGDVFRATLCRISDPAIDFRVLNLKKRMDTWEGVKVIVVGKDVRAELDGKIVERRSTCFAFETTPFGLITYPLGLKSIPEDVEIGDYLRVRAQRFRDESQTDHPSKWQVTRVKNRLLSPVTTEAWFEGIVTSINGARVVISFKHGNAEYNTTCGDDMHLSLGTVVDIFVRDTGYDSHFEVCEIDKRTRIREDIKVEKNEDKEKAIFTVSCTAEVIGKRDGYFLLDTPIIGLAQFFFGECPISMRVGQIWDVKMHRRKDKRDLPSHWVAHGVERDSPRSTAMGTVRRNEGRRARGGKDREEDLPSTTQNDDHLQWGTVIITGSKDGDWFAACHLSDSIIIPLSLLKNLAIPKRGSFYRIKCSMDNGRMKAYDLNPDPVHPTDLDVFGNVDVSLQVWCYARIDRSESKSFTVYNRLLGEATLPHKFAHPEMRVGDWIKALYYRVKTTKNPTHWMVQRSKMSRDTGRKEEEMRVKGEEGESNVHSENRSGSRVGTETTQWTSRIEKKKDRRVLESMRYFATLPEIREILKRGNPEDLEVIDKILDRDRTRSQQ